MMDTYLIPWKKYATFTGRATRKEYWTFYLVNTIIGVLFGFMHGNDMVRLMGGGDFQLTLLSIVFFLFLWAALIPTIAVVVRRLHDIGRSGWWWLISFVPLLGGLILLIMLLLDSQPGANEYGPNPKEMPA